MSLIRFKRRLSTSTTKDFPSLACGEPYYDIKGGNKLYVGDGNVDTSGKKHVAQLGAKLNSDGTQLTITVGECTGNNIIINVDANQGLKITGSGNSYTISFDESKLKTYLEETVLTDAAKVEF